MKNRTQLVMLVSSLFLQGCATNIYLRDDAPPEVPPTNKLTVYVTNPHLAKEYRALKQSGIFYESNNRQCLNKLTLHEMHYVCRCGNPFMITNYTLGMVPASAAIISSFSYDLETPEGTFAKHHALPIERHYSLWERFVRPFHSDADVLADGLSRVPNPEQQ